MGNCTVGAGTYSYGNVNIYNGGRLEFLDADIDFWARSILVENNSSLIAGTPNNPIGNNGTLTIYLYGSENDKAGIECKTDAMCGVNTTIWNSNTLSTMNPPSCQKSDLPGGVNDCFYQYSDMNNVAGETGFFGVKVLAVSYDGTLQMYGKKGVTFSNLPSSDSGTSWVRLDGSLSKGATSLKVDRAVPNWEDGDHVVLTTTDYLPTHSEKLEITNKISDTEFEFKVLDPHTNDVMSGGLQYPHNGDPYLLNEVPLRLGLDFNKVETRAAVALLSRSIRIVSAGDTMGNNFPAPTPGEYFGAHMQIRQGAKQVQIQGVEFRQMGQGGRKGRYPVHFHMMRKTPENTFIKDSSINESMNRFITLHATHGVRLARNVGYLSIGHGYYLEDGTEINNQFQSNIGIFARPAIKDDDGPNKNNPREVPGILAAPNLAPPIGVAGENVPFRSDYIHPTVFWIMNGWNDFEYNMAAGAGTCGACYWLVPGSNSGPSQNMKWESYASLQQNFGNAATTPLKKFKGNYCTTAMNAFNTVGDTAVCHGIDATGSGLDGHPVFKAIQNPNAKNFPDQMYYPRVDGGGGRWATICSKSDPNAMSTGQDDDEVDCSRVIRCGSGNPKACKVTVLDRFTSAFNWAETNFSAVWLRPQWFLVLNSVVSDVQNAGVTFVTGGDYTQSSSPQGNWLLARQNVFIGHTQKETMKDNFASAAGPVNPGTDLRCGTKSQQNPPGNYCILKDEMITIPISNFGNNQRLFNIYDGPAQEDSNAYLDITKTFLEFDNCSDPKNCCKPNENRNCTDTNWMYGRVLGVPKNVDPERGLEDRCILPNAAIAWKQPNGFYYPPDFHSTNLYFNNVDIRHFVIEPMFDPGTRDTAKASRDRYCTWNDQLFTGFTSVDRQTVLNDDDGSLTGFRKTISVNEDPFFNTPVEQFECLSDKTAITSPYEHITTAVYPGCNGRCPENSKGQPPVNWGKDCATPNCYGVPTYRQLLTKTENDNKESPNIRLMGMAIWQRSNLTANNGVYFIDTTVTRGKQLRELPAPPPPNPDLIDPRNINVFEKNGTYYLYLIYAKPTTEQTYQVYVGNDFDISTVTAVRTELAAEVLEFNQVAWPWKDPVLDEHGVLTVTMNMGFMSFSSDFKKAKAASCGPESFCVPDGSECVCSTKLIVKDASGKEDKDLYDQCIKKIGSGINKRTICSWANNDVDCPEGGCYGFAFTLPSGFVADGRGANNQSNQGIRPDAKCFKSGPNSPWDIKWDPALDMLAGKCANITPPKADFCDSQQEVGFSRNVIRGTEGDDELIGTNGPDLIIGGAGNDIIRGRGGNDEIEGGPGDDIIDGNVGNDLIVGGDGNDTISGGKGHDDIQAGDGDDTVRGGRGNDDISGGDGNDFLKGQNGEDEIDGGPGDDLIEGGRGSDDIDGGSGNDVLMGQGGGDEIDGGSGDDMIDGGSGIDTCLEGEMDTECEIK